MTFEVVWYRGFDIRGKRGSWRVEGRAEYRTLAAAKTAIRGWIDECESIEENE